jgi:hypothetical protein
MIDDDEAGALLGALEMGAWEEYVKLVGEFEKARGKGTLWPVLARAHPSRIDILERLLAWPAPGVTLALRKLMPAVEHLEHLGLEDAVRFLEFANRPGPSFRHGVALQLQPHISSSADLGTKLGDALRRGDLRGDGAARVWAGAFSAAAPEQAARFALACATRADSDAALLATLLQFIPAKDPKVLALLGPREAELTASLLAGVQSNGRDVWVALTAIMDWSAAATNALNTAVRAAEVDAVIAMSNAMYQVSGTTVGAAAIPLDQLVDHLLGLALSNDEVRQSVDSGVEALLYREALRPTVLPCIAKLRAADTDVAERLPEMFSALGEKQSDFTWLLTRWLVDEGTTFAAVRSLLSRCSAQQAPVGLDADVFRAAPTARKVVAARRLLALTHDGPVLCRFIADLAEGPALQPHGLELAAQMLNAAFAEYPGATVEFLRERTKTTRRTEPFAAVYRGVYANALKWRRVLKRLPPRKELRPTDGQLHVLRAMRQRINREIMRTAGERSVFAGLFTSVHVAQGQRFTSHTADSEPQVFDMQASSHSMELPSSELSDPVGGMLARAKQLAASR